MPKIVRHSTMAGEASQKRKGKISRQESCKSGKDSEIDVDRPIAGASTQDKTRTGVRVYKIVVLGDGGVGKSGRIFFFSTICIEFSVFVLAVTLQFVSHSFLDYHDPTIGK